MRKPKKSSNRRSRSTHDTGSTSSPRIEFGPPAMPANGVLVVFSGQPLVFGTVTKRVLAPVANLVAWAASADRFTGKSNSALDLVMPAGTRLARLIVMGVGKDESKPREFAKLGGAAFGRVPASAQEVTILADLPGQPVKPQQAADLALGVSLRAYTFERYKTKRKEGEEKRENPKVTLALPDHAAARKAWGEREALHDGVVVARDLVNEPPNVLYPEEFARRAADLRKVGIAVEVLDVKTLKKLGMNALLGVGQGSARESRLVVMRWNGGKQQTPPVAFIGKGVCFDTGGISIKPAQGMEDMKGDMAGAACVVGLMHALAARKAKVNAVGAIGIVENMPGPNAQRPGDIVTSMSGQTIEIINTDAEGRLVLADVLWYVNKRFQPKFMVNLATLTGAIITALGQEHAGLFSNNDELSQRLREAGEAIGERVWRMPLAPEYDKLIDSKFADVKNTGGRHAGAITAAQFLQRFVEKTPWAHLDIAGTAMGSPQTDINRSWASGWGVRLLDRLVAEHYEV